MTAGHEGHEVPGGGPQRCAQCGNEHFEEGFLADNVESSPGHARWIPGAPVRGLLGTIKLTGRRRDPILAFRCTVCHHLELYVGPG
jgi:hypothetical protein